MSYFLKCKGRERDSLGKVMVNVVAETAVKSLLRGGRREPRKHLQGGLERSPSSKSKSLLRGVRMHSSEVRRLRKPPLSRPLSGWVCSKRLFLSATIVATTAADLTRGDCGTNPFQVANTQCTGGLQNEAQSTALEGLVR